MSHTAASPTRVIVPSGMLGGGVSPRHLEAGVGLVKRIAVRNLNVLKVSYPRPQPQGWKGERDMHQGQSFARLLDLEVVPAVGPTAT